MADELILDSEFCRTNKINPLKLSVHQRRYALKCAISEYKDIQEEFEIYKSNKKRVYKIIAIGHNNTYFIKIPGY